MACRRRDEKRNLLRIVRTPSGGLAFDSGRNLAGRGAYLCADTKCLSDCRERGLFGRQLRRPDSAALYLAVAEHLRKGRDPGPGVLIGFAVRAGRCAFGAEAVELETNRGRIHLIVLSGDAGADTARKVNGLAGRKGVPVLVFRGGRSLGEIAGKPNCRVLGVRDREFAVSIRSAAAAAEPSGDASPVAQPGVPPAAFPDAAGNRGGSATESALESDER
jgi:uncharacterized protein